MNDSNNENLFSKKLKAGKRRTYFFDVRATKSNDYFVTLTESKRRFNGDGYDRHKIFLYKEDFNKFIIALTETIDHVKTELMPDFDFDAFNHDEFDETRSPATFENTSSPQPTKTPLEFNEEASTESLINEIKTVAEEKSVELENPTSNDEAETW